MRTGPQWQSTRKVESGRGPLGPISTRTANTARAAAHREPRARALETERPDRSPVHGPRQSARCTPFFIFIIISFRSSTFTTVYTRHEHLKGALRGGGFCLPKTQPKRTVNANHDANTQRNGATHTQRGVTNSRPNTARRAHGATKHSTVPILYRPCGALPWRQPTGPAQESL